VRSRFNGFASGDPLTLSILSSFLGQRGNKADEAAGIVGLKCEVDGAGGRGLDGDANGILDFVGDPGLEDGKAKAEGRGLGTVDL